MFGISAALTTPFDDNGSLDTNRLNEHIRSVMGQGCSGVTMFGTTGEGPSVPVNTRLETLRSVAKSAVSAEKIVLTVHGAAIGDVLMQMQAGLALGVRKFLLPPPCYYGDPPLQGLASWFGSVLDGLEGTGAQVILYHIPQVIGVGLPIDLVAQLAARYPSLIYGVKDSSGSFENTTQLLQMQGLNILVGDERQLAAGARLGASGAISGVANVFSDRLAQTLTSRAPDPDLDRLVDTVVQFPVTPAIKALVAHKYSDPDWRRTSAPLVATPDKDYGALTKAFDAVGSLAITG